MILASARAIKNSLTNSYQKKPRVDLRTAGKNTFCSRSKARLKLTELLNSKSTNNLHQIACQFIPPFPPVEITFDIGCPLPPWLDAPLKVGKALLWFMSKSV